jgi:alkanesulfonate monooxygenase SsuD/methylene tetrahydromethanopterin reductase-like flavin-dependent oxidoreductase (luciferase family)
LAAHASSPRAGQPFVCAGFFVASVDKDRAAAYERSKSLLSYLFSSPYKIEDWALNGVTVDHAAILQALQRGDAEAARQLVSDDLVALCSATGTPAEFQARFQQFVALGLDRTVIAPLGGPEEKRLAVRLAVEALND